MRDYREFEQPIREIEERIEKLTGAGAARGSVQDEIRKLKARLAQTEIELYSRLTPWQRTQLARHALRPPVLDSVAAMRRDVVGLHGDRALRDDGALVRP